MSKPKVAVHHLGGCDRCAWQTLAIADWEEYNLVHHSLLDGEEAPKDMDVDVLDRLVFAEYDELFHEVLIRRIEHDGTLATITRIPSGWPDPAVFELSIDLTSGGGITYVATSSLHVLFLS